MSLNLALHTIYIFNTVIYIVGVLCLRKSEDPNSVEGKSLYISIEAHQLPIIYRQEYNVSFLGLEKLHPFDAAKWGNIYQVL